VVVVADADLKLALRAVVFGSVGTAGQRCTSTRRLILQRPIAQKFLNQLVHAYRTIGIGDPLDEKTLMGPLISDSAVKDYLEGLDEMQKQGGKVLFGGEKATGGGRQAGSDAWKGYMRRQTNTINYGTQLPLAQGVEFPVD